MSDDVAFRIQLGLILPKITDQIGPNLTRIVDELVSIVQAGTVESDAVDLAQIKEVIMKDLEIYLDGTVFPKIEARLNPPEGAPAAGGIEAEPEENTDE